MNSEQLNELVMAALDDGKAQDIVKLDVRDLTAVTDYMIVASGTSNRWAMPTRSGGMNTRKPLAAASPSPRQTLTIASTGSSNTLASLVLVIHHEVMQLVGKLVDAGAWRRPRRAAAVGGREERLARPSADAAECRLALFTRKLS